MLELGWKWFEASYSICLGEDDVSFVMFVWAWG
jgi:hypothetical protein